MTAQIDRNELVELAQGMIRIPSVSGNELELAVWLVDWCRERGIDAELQFATPDRPNVIARVGKSSGPKSLILNGHIDMTEVLDIYEGDPYSADVVDGRLRGAGISNMKGAVAGMFATAAALQRSGDSQGEVIVTAVVGECDQLGLGTKAALAAGITADAAINGEPTGQTIQLSHTGVYQVAIEVKGHPAHQTEREKGIDAIARAVKVHPHLTENSLTFEVHPALGAPQMIVGQIRGGVMPQVLAPSCELILDIRTVPGMTKDSITVDIETMIGNALDRADYELDILAYSDPFAMDADSPICQAVAEAHTEILGEAPVVVADRVLGVTDCSHLQAYKIPTALYGPAVFQMTENYDFIEVDELVSGAEVFLSAAGKFFAGAS